MAIVIMAFSKKYTPISSHHIGWVFIIVLIHNLVALSTGYTAASAFRLQRIDRRTVTIETGIQNSGLALVLLFNPNIFPETIVVDG